MKTDTPASGICANTTAAIKQKTRTTQMAETSDNQAGPETSDKRVFAEAWKKRAGSFVLGVLLTTKKIYIGSYDKVIVYDTVTGQMIADIVIGWGNICDISLSRDGKSLFVACEDGTARIINLDTGEEVILRGHTYVVSCIIQGEGTDVLTCSWDNTIRRWNSLTGECLKIYQGHTDRVFSILYDKPTKRIFSASDDMMIIVWNGDTGERFGVMEEHRDYVKSLAQVNSTTIASGSDDGTIKLWDMTTLACIKTIANGSTVRSLVATPDGQYLISGSGDNKVNVWSVATGQCVHTLSHHTSYVLKVAVSPDGRFIASGGHDGMVHLFSASTPLSVAIRQGVLVHDSRGMSISLFSDGTVRCNGDLIATVTSTSTCSIVSENRIVICGSASVEFAAPSASAAHLWSEAISAVATDLALHPDDRASSADQMICRYRFNLLQTILVHLRERGTRKWHIPREMVQIIGGYTMQG
jgi:WD40 repeat protein